ncbi:MAG: DUF47 domain-containing protein [Candidatus Thorarchaeota archaeon]
MNKIKEQIITMLLEHSRIIYNVISDMGVYYTSWAESYEANKESLEKKRSKMILSEEDADAIKIRIIKEFAEIGAQGMGDYIALVLKMDNVINSALEFVDILTFLKDSKLSDSFKKNYHKLINNIIKMSDVLKLTIKNLRDNRQEVFNNTTTIHEIENDIDSIFRGFLSDLYSDQNLNIRKLLQIRDSVMTLEKLADRIHDIADIIRIILYS